MVIVISFPALHKDYPLVCRWFISLARRDHFTSAIWKASNDVGFDAFHDYIKGSKKPLPTSSSSSSSQPQEGGAAAGRAQTKGKGQNVKASKPTAGAQSSRSATKKATVIESHVSLTSSLCLSLPTILIPSSPPPLFSSHNSDNSVFFALSCSLSPPPFSLLASTTVTYLL